jgi:hypothetical protein
MLATAPAIAEHDVLRPDENSSTRRCAEQRPPERSDRGADLAACDAKPIRFPVGSHSSHFITSSSDSNRASSRHYLSALMNDDAMLYICRYGAGCTHRREKLHRTHFWHPSVPELDGNC